MLTFGTIALEQFLDKLNNWPNYVNLIYAEKQNINKNNPKLGAKIEEKYNEIFNKNKSNPPQNDSLNVKNQNASAQLNQYASNFINFEGDKKNNAINNNLSTVPKMAKVQEGVFFSNYNTLNKYPYNMTNTDNQFVNYIPGQPSVFKQGQINQQKGIFIIIL